MKQRQSFSAKTCSRSRSTPRQPSDINTIAIMAQETKRPLSTAYTTFARPIDDGFDFHIYYMQHNPTQVQFAKELHDRIKTEFPELHINQYREKESGPHPVAQFEVDTFTPHETGALFCWLAVNRGPLSVLVHPNTSSAMRDHTEFASWMGTPYPLNSDILKVGIKPR